MSGGDRRTSTHDPAATPPAASPPAPLRQRWRAPTCTPAAGGGVLAPETAAADPAAVVPAAPVLHRLRPRASGLIAVQQRLPDMPARTGKQRSMPARSPASLREAAVPARQRPCGCGGGACRLWWRLRPEQLTGSSGGWQARPSEPAPHRRLCTTTRALRCFGSGGGWRCPHAPGTAVLEPRWFAPLAGGGGRVQRRRRRSDQREGMETLTAPPSSSRTHMGRLKGPIGFGRMRFWSVASMGSPQRPFQFFSFSATNLH
uniref:Uncharacterized protein n=1 Tax=Setaria viridis TaxID=4556 RepID=A0A4U6UQZ9_SETVI|nr:hypothetical protein SEVIR_5G332733v2 [Setaria viridis]